MMQEAVEDGSGGGDEDVEMPPEQLDLGFGGGNRLQSVLVPQVVVGLPAQVVLRRRQGLELAEEVKLAQNPPCPAAFALPPQNTGCTFTTVSLAGAGSVPGGTLPYRRPPTLSTQRPKQGVQFSAQGEF